jgi:Rrf2 family protein
MNVSAKTEYAAIAMLELAANYGSDRPVRIRQIAASHGVPSRFLVQILLQLKGAGFVASTRGAAGGYRLVVDPQEITLGQIMAVVDGRSSEHTSNAALETPASRVLMKTWRQVAAVERDMLSAVTLAELAKQAKDQTADMYFI